jgi:GNAT superfamily N-acetyltransferase
MISAMNELARCIAFDRHVLLHGASERAEIPEGWVARHRGLPSVFSLNMVILSSPVPPTVGPADVEMLADRWLDDVGHRFIRIEDPAAADRLAPALLEAGWERQRTLLMTLTEDAPAAEPDPRARPISEAELDAVMRADFEVDFPRDAFPGLADMLVDAQRSLRQGTPALRFGAGVDDGLQSMGTLFMEEGPDGHRMAMIEQVATLPEYRERGLARGVVSAAISAAREWGADTVMIRADADDWPQVMYANLGFAPAARHASFLRRPPGSPRAHGAQRGA